MVYEASSQHRRRTNFRDVSERYFGHIDGDFVGCKADLPDGQVSFTLRFSPWSNNPKLITVQEPEEVGSDNNRIEAGEWTVHAIHVLQYHYEASGQIEDAWFDENDPLVWQYDRHDTILCNGRVEPAMVRAIVASLRQRLGHSKTVAAYISSIRGTLEMYGSTPPFALPQLPECVARPLRNLLTAEGVELYDGGSQNGAALSKPLPVVFHADHNYIVAGDFEVEIPNVIHRPEYIATRRKLNAA